MTFLSHYSSPLLELFLTTPYTPFTTRQLFLSSMCSENGPKHSSSFFHPVWDSSGFPHLLSSTVECVELSAAIRHDMICCKWQVSLVAGVGEFEGLDPFWSGMGTARRGSRKTGCTSTLNLAFSASCACEARALSSSCLFFAMHSLVRNSFKTTKTFLMTWLCLVSLGHEHSVLEFSPIHAWANSSYPIPVRRPRLWLSLRQLEYSRCQVISNENTLCVQFLGLTCPFGGRHFTTRKNKLKMNYFISDDVRIAFTK